MRSKLSPPITALLLSLAIQPMPAGATEAVTHDQQPIHHDIRGVLQLNDVARATDVRLETDAVQPPVRDALARQRSERRRPDAPGAGV
jgi:hypothetical protein